MRVLLLMRGSAGVGKTTFIKENNLSQYALSADDIRIMYQSPVLQPDGSFAISQANDKDVWNTLYSILEARMQRGEFVVVDATNSKTAEINKYKDLAQNYRYRIYLADFTDVPIEECKRRNKQRPIYKQVPDEVIEKFYSRFATQKVPAGVTVIKPSELDTIWYRKSDFSDYKKINHIGDIHGCYTALQQYLKDGLKDDELYIFCGDYIDRGIENVEVIKFLIDIKDRKNVILLEGNHERWLWYWAHGVAGKSSEFEKNTRPQLEASDIDPKDVRSLYRKFGQCAYYKYGEKTVLVTHAGLSIIPDNLTFIATEQMIKGVGQYSDYRSVANTFDKVMPEDVFQVFGHRNSEACPVQLSERCFDLEGSVEFGGDLRAVELDNEGFHPVQIKNTVFRPIDTAPTVEYSKKELSVLDTVEEMRRNRYISEKKYGNISSFNFTRDAFYDKKWNEQTVKARGLFINTVDGKVVCRSYPKFFNINERPETKFNMLRFKLKFPVTAYVKENGFLGMVSYNPETDDFFIASKSSPEGDFANYMRDAFNSNVRNSDMLKLFLESNDLTLVFECVDMEHDPHIIKYGTSHLFLLDIVKNDLTYQKFPYSAVCEVAKQFGFEVKTKAAILNDWEQFRDWYYEVMDDGYLFNDHEIEGFVIEDSSGFMVKLKLAYYNLWKHMRAVAQETLKSGNYRRTGSLLTPLENQFFGFCKKLYGTDCPTNIIALRDMFYDHLSSLR